MINKFKKLIEEENRLKKERAELEKEFTNWLTSHEHWKVFVCNLITETGNHEKYRWTREYILDHMTKSISGFEVLGDKIKFTVRIIDENSGSMFPSGIYVETGYFDVEKLQTISDVKPNPQDVLSRIERKEKRVKYYEEDIEKLQKQIESEKEELKNLRSWIE